MKRTWGVVLVVIGVIAAIYTLLVGVFILELVAGAILGAGIALLGARDFAIVKSELREEEGVFRLHVTVKNNQKRSTALWFVANVYHNGVSIGVVNSNSIILNELGTGELVAVLPRPSKDTRKEEITWQIVRWNFK